MNRLAGCLAGFLAGFLPDVTSDAELQPPDMDRAFGETAAAQIKGWKEREAAARSARTQRSSRSSRGWTIRSVVQGFRSGLDGNERAECRVDSVKHSPSPSHREKSRRAIITSVFKASLPPPNIRLSDRRAAAYLSLSSSTRSRTPRSQSLHRRSASQFPQSHFPCPERAEYERHARKFRHRTAILILLRVTNSASLGKRR